MESHIKNMVFLPFFPSHDRTTGASARPLGCMERVWAMEWAMESHSNDYWSFWATWLQVVFG